MDNKIEKLGAAIEKIARDVNLINSLPYPKNTEESRWNGLVTTTLDAARKLHGEFRRLKSYRDRG